MDDSPLVLPSDQRPVVTWESGIRATPPDLDRFGIMPGSFNPLHAGHLQLRRAASKFLERRVAFELSASNVDKPSLTSAVIRERLQQFATETVLLTNAALFTQKAELFPGCWFIVGMDTAVRLLEPRYYDGSIGRRDDALRFFENRDVRFLVAGRLAHNDEQPEFRTCKQLGIAETCPDLFVELPEQRFRVDISSTAIRNSRPSVNNVGDHESH